MQDCRPTHAHRAGGERGFTLIEALFAMLLLVSGLMVLAQVFAVGLTHLASSSANIVAREKAREAIESVHTARDTRVITWTQIRNVSNGGIFRDAEEPLLTVGADGLVNTADDGPGVEFLTLPGPDNQLGTADDVQQPLNRFFRRIEIRDVAGNTTLRRLRIIIRYPTSGQAPPATCVRGDGTPITRPGCYVLTTFVSSFS